jgi:hypothetical protein
MILRLLNATMPLIQNRYTDFAGPFLNGHAAHRTSVPRSIEWIKKWSLHAAFCVSGLSDAECSAPSARQKQEAIRRNCAVALRLISLGNPVA